MLVVKFENGFNYGIIVGKNEFIVTQSDFVHFTQPKGEPVESLPVGYSKSDSEPDAEGRTRLSLEEIVKTFTLDELLALAVETKLSEFGHYWGIKSRVAYNYHLLHTTAEEIGADIVLPEWGAK